MKSEFLFMTTIINSTRVLFMGVLLIFSSCNGTEKPELFGVVEIPYDRYSETKTRHLYKNGNWREGMRAGVWLDVYEAGVFLKVCRKKNKLVIREQIDVNKNCIKRNFFYHQATFIQDSLFITRFKDEIKLRDFGCNQIQNINIPEDKTVLADVLRGCFVEGGYVLCSLVQNNANRHRSNKEHRERFFGNGMLHLINIESGEFSVLEEYPKYYINTTDYYSAHPVLSRCKNGVVVLTPSVDSIYVVQFDDKTATINRRRFSLLEKGVMSHETLDSTRLTDYSYLSEYLIRNPQYQAVVSSPESEYIYVIYQPKQKLYDENGYFGAGHPPAYKLIKTNIHGEKMGEFELESGKYNVATSFMINDTCYVKLIDTVGINRAKYEMFH